MNPFTGALTQVIKLPFLAPRKNLFHLAKAVAKCTTINERI